MKTLKLGLERDKERKMKNTTDWFQRQPRLNSFALLALGFFESWKTKLGMVVRHDKMKRLATAFVFVLEIHFSVFFRNFNLPHSRKKRTIKDQWPLFSSCLDAQPCEISFCNSQKPKCKHYSREK